MPFPVLQTVPEVRSWRAEAFAGNKKVGFVATMGALHDGHLELARQSLRLCDMTIVSIFVNPAQFAPHEDLSTYPRPLESDLCKLKELVFGAQSISAVFVPPVVALYPDGIVQDLDKQKGTFVEVKGMSHQMEGGSRPTFFRGVATVVTKLFNIVQPDTAFFGQKDVQQCIVLRQMLRDLHLPYPASVSDLVVVPTVRESDGLALSSRNAYLTTDDRKLAPLLSRALCAAQSTYKSLRARDSTGDIETGPLLEAAHHIIQDGSNMTSAGNIRVDYLSINDATTLTALSTIRAGQGVIISGAMWVGRTRLIDNVVIDFAFG